MRDRERQTVIYRTPQFDRCLDDLRKKGGTAAAAARKVDDFINNLMQKENSCVREKFRLTRNGEYRIKNCIKIDLVGGYRLVCIKKDGHMAFVYVGTHDDCFRWIERNKGLEYKYDAAKKGNQVVRRAMSVADEDTRNIHEEDTMVNTYEASLMSRLDDAVLRRIFSGLCRRE